MANPSSVFVIQVEREGDEFVAYFMLNPHIKLRHKYDPKFNELENFFRASYRLSDRFCLTPKDYFWGEAWMKMLAQLSV